MITIESRLTAELHAFAEERGVKFTDAQAAAIVAMRIRVDAEREQARAIVATRPEAPVMQRGTITAIGADELQLRDGPYLLLRLDDQVWAVPDRPDGWEFREPWFGDVNSVRWIGGPPARAAFRRVGAPRRMS